MKFYEDKDYIKMCEKAVEIQKLWQYKLGDFVWNWKDGEYGIISRFGLIEDVVNYYETIIQCEKSICVLDHHFIWLPRQDQLQEMINWDYGIDLLRDIYEIRFSILYDGCASVCETIKGKKLEQILLQMIMKRNFNKSWNSETENWI